MSIVPRLAATLASLLLIASSIGVNIARYPQVGQTADTGQPADAAQPAPPVPAAQPASLVERTNPDPLPARETKIEPAKSPVLPAVAPAKNTHVAAPVDPHPAAKMAPAQPEPVVTILNVRPLVPIASLPIATGGAEPLAGSDEVRRLPPVKPGVSAIPEIPAGGSDGARPYPATGTP